TPFRSVKNGAVYVSLTSARPLVSCSNSFRRRVGPIPGAASRAHPHANSEPERDSDGCRVVSRTVARTALGRRPASYGSRQPEGRPHRPVCLEPHGAFRRSL